MRLVSDSAVLVWCCFRISRFRFRFSRLVSESWLASDSAVLVLATDSVVLVPDFSADRALFGCLDMGHDIGQLKWIPTAPESFTRSLLLSSKHSLRAPQH